MARYYVKTKFVFSGVFEVEAFNREEAKELILKECGLVMGGDIHRGITNILYKSNFKVIPPTNNFFYVIIVFVYFLLFLLFCILYQPLLVKA